MSRTLSSAKASGANFEQKVADYLAFTWDDRIERRTKHGAKDRGDISGFRVGGRNVVVECKEYGGKFHVGEWLSEAETERVNAGAAASVVIAKRRGVTAPGSQVVFMTALDFVTLLTLARKGGRGEVVSTNDS